MLRIRDAQMASLAADAQRRFITRTRVHLRGSHPDETAGLDDEGLDARLLRGVERARGRGLVTERDIGQYLELDLLLGAGFEAAPDTAWSAAYLDDPDVPDPGERIARLRAEVTRRVDLQEHPGAAPNDPAVTSDGPSRRIDEPIAACPRRDHEWIEIYLLDETNTGVANEPYRLILPDGSERRGKTDAAGRVRVDGLPSGQCRLTFPRLDRESCQPL
jgi:hypothetical protein